MQDHRPVKMTLATGEWLKLIGIALAIGMANAAFQASIRADVAANRRDIDRIETTMKDSVDKQTAAITRIAVEIAELRGEMKNSQ